jgi:hypothetical protein
MLAVLAVQAQEALERRRLERMRMDELMRNPAQQPAAPKKNILRRGAGSALRVPAAIPAPSTKQTARPPASAPAAAAVAPAGHDRPDLDRQRREWSEGLKQYIARQRETLRTAPDGKVRRPCLVLACCLFVYSQQLVNHCYADPSRWLVFGAF